MEFHSVDNGVDVWQSIADAVDNWSRRILDVECLHDRSNSFRTLIETSIQRLALDGFLSAFELNELRDIADKWLKLLDILSSYAIGNRCTIVKREILLLLLDLYDLHQLNAETLIDCCIHL